MADTFLVRPSGNSTPANDTLRIIAVADVPSLDAAKITSGLFDVARMPLAVAQWVKVATKTYTQLSVAGLTNDIEAYSLPASYAIHGAALRVTTGFSGGTIASYTLSLGISGTLAKYVAAFNAAAAGFGIQAAGIALPALESFSGATSIRLAAISTVGLLSAATQGGVDIWLCLAKLP